MRRSASCAADARRQRAASASVRTVALIRGPPRAARAPARAARAPPRPSAGAGAGAAIRSTARTRPGRGESTTTVSASSAASSTSWVTSTTVRGSRSSAPASHSCISARVIASSAPNGSSRHSSGLPESSVRRNATRWRMPPESSLARAVSKPSSPSSANIACARSRACVREAPAMRSASAALSSASSHGSSRSRWGIRTAGGALSEPRVGRLQAADQLQQRRLAAAGRADDREHLAGLGLAARRSCERLRPIAPAAVAVAARDVPYAQRPRRCCLPRCGLSGGLYFGGHVAPFAGITPQVQRVGAGGS